MARPAKSSPFYDVDGLTSDGTRTANFWLSGPESEANMAGLEYYNGPGLQFDMDYRRFLHRLGVKPMWTVVPGGLRPNGFAPEGGFYNPARRTFPGLRHVRLELASGRRRRFRPGERR